MVHLQGVQCKQPVTIHVYMLHACALASIGFVGIAYYCVALSCVCVAYLMHNLPSSGWSTS